MVNEYGWVCGLGLCICHWLERMLFETFQNLTKHTQFWCKFLRGDEYLIHNCFGCPVTPHTSIHTTRKYPISKRCSTVSQINAGHAVVEMPIANVLLASLSNLPPFPPPPQNNNGGIILGYHFEPFRWNNLKHRFVLEVELRVGESECVSWSDAVALASAITSNDGFGSHQSVLSPFQPVVIVKRNKSRADYSDSDSSSGPAWHRQILRCWWVIAATTTKPLNE